MAETITRLSGQGSSGSATSFSALAPNSTTTIPGAFRLLTFFWYGTGTIGAPAQWTPVMTPLSVLGGIFGCYYKYHVPGEGAYTFTKSSSGGFVGRITNLSGVDPDNPIDVAPVFTNQATAATVYSNVPSLTTVTPGAWVWWWLVAGLVATSSRTFSADAAGWTPEAQVVWATTQGLVGLGAYEEFLAPADTGARTARYTINSQFRGLALALRPAGAGGGGGVARTNDHFHALAHHQADRPGELWTPPDRQLHRPRRRRILDLAPLPVAA